MTLMAFLQIAYLAINLIGIILSVVALFNSESFPFVSQLFSFSKKHLGKIPTVILGLVFIALFIPALTFNAVATVLIMLCGACTD
jgi:hypothetical protein